MAVKVIGSGVLASDEERCRFYTEAEAAAQMRHPAIVPIHDIGTADGYAYFSMTLIEGPTLQQFVQQRSCTFEQAACYVRDIAHAVAYAHRPGILHRDLKPENILTDAEGRPWLTDFGLAKWHRLGTLLTRTGQVLGTPAYMSPEQAAGRSDIGPTTDIYSLGAILYALLIARPPYEGDNAADVLLQVQQADPPRPREIEREIPIDLEKIMMRCLEREPAHRYATADALADDLQRFLDGEPVEAASSGWLHTMARSLSRDQHQQHFRSWGQGLFIIGCVIFAAHLTIFAFDQTGAPEWLAFWIPRLSMFVILAGVIHHYRGGKWTPRNNAERPIWSIWIGYLITLTVMNLLVLVSGIPERTIFPMAAALSGFGFLSLGGHIWGGCTLIGLGFQLVTLLTALLPEIAPLVFGTAWLFATSALARRYHATQTNPRSS